MTNLRFDGREVWYHVVGAGAKPPLVCVPGGPALPHDYIDPVAAVAASGRPVVFYDPLGSGRSERPARRWSQDLFVAELAALIEALGLRRYHLFAHSAAALAAYPHALARPAGLAGLVLAGCPADIPAHHAAVRPLLGLTPAELEHFERAEHHLVPRDARYVQITDRYARRYMCRATPIPASFVRALRTGNPDAHKAMKGGLVFFTTALATWDVTGDLGAIAAPTLITCGRDDPFTPAAARAIAERIPRAEVAIFEGSAHMPHVEEPAAYIARLVAFLDGCD